MSVLHQLDQVHFLHDRWVNGILNQHLSPAMSPGQFRLLMCLWQEGGISQKTLGERVGLQKNTVSAMLSLLKAHGLIEITPDEKDGRSRLVSLTEAGVQIREQHQVKMVAAENTLFDGITPDELDLFSKMLAQLIHNLEEENRNERKPR